MKRVTHTQRERETVPASLVNVISGGDSAAGDESSVSVHAYDSGLLVKVVCPDRGCGAVSQCQGRLGQGAGDQGCIGGGILFNVGLDAKSIVIIALCLPK